MKMSEASFNLSFIRLLPRAYNLRNFKNNNKNDFFCNLQPTRCAKIQTSWAWNCYSIILTKSVWKVMTTMGHDVHGIETLCLLSVTKFLLFCLIKPHKFCPSLIWGPAWACCYTQSVSKKKINCKVTIFIELAKIV